MTKYILTPSPDSPDNLALISLPYNASIEGVLLPFAGYETEAEMVAAVVARNIETGLIGTKSYWVVDKADLPDGDMDDPGNLFFDAWEWNNHVEVNMTKARNIHMDQIRVVRDKELKKLDIPFMRSVEIGNVIEQTRIANLKQSLRDIPATFNLNAYTTPRELKSAWPEELPIRGRN